VAWRLSTSGFGCKARTTNTVTWGTNVQTQTDTAAEATGQLLSAVHSGDGKLVLQFQFPYKKWSSLESALGSASTQWEAKSEFALRLTLGSDVWNDAYGATLFDDHHVLSDSGYNYADVYVENVQTVNRNPVWSYNESTVTPWNWARCEVPTWTAIVTLKMNYQNYHATEKYIHYVQTYVDDWGQEGPASVASERLLVKPGQKITVARHGAAGTEPGSPYVARRLYRSAAGSEEDGFFFVAEQSDFTASYEDNIQDANLGEKLPETENPVDGMTGLIAMPGGWLAAFKGNTMYCSEPFKPYNWPTEYQLAFDYNIVALAASGNDVVVLTEGTPYLVSGAEPETLTQTRLMIPQACVAKRGVAQISGGVIYPSPDGLIVIRGGQATVVTEPFYTRAEWQALTPATMIGNVHDDRYYGFLAAGGGIIVDFKNGAAALTTTTESATATFSDLQSDTFYVVQSGQIKAWGGGSPLTLTWKSKVFEMDRSESFIVARVRAAGNVTLRLYADGVLKHSEAITSAQDVVLPRTLDSGTRWEFQVEAAAEVYEVLLVQRQIIDVGDSPVVIKDQDGRFSWKGLLFRFHRTGTFHMGRLVAESGAVVKLYRDTTLDQSVTVTTDTDFRFAEAEVLTHR
jgi:hypothetical protein